MVPSKLAVIETHANENSESVGIPYTTDMIDGCRMHACMNASYEACLGNLHACMHLGIGKLGRVQQLQL